MAHENDLCDGSKGSSRIEPVAAVVVKDWGNLIRTLEDERILMVLLRKRQLNFEGPENQQLT